MDCDDDVAAVPLLMLVAIKATTLLGQPFPKYSTFHAVLLSGLPGSRPVKNYADWRSAASGSRQLTQDRRQFLRRPNGLGSGQGIGAAMSRKARALI
jgi:hypothetical protein